MRTTHVFFLVLGLTVVAGGCDKTGVHALGVKRNITEGCDTPTSTWLRSTTDGTELLLIGSTNPTSGVGSPNCFARGTIAHDSSTTLDVGDYTYAGAAGTFTYAAHYSFPYQPSLGLLERIGSKRDDLMPPMTVALGFTMDTDGTLLATLDGTQHRYTNLVDVIKNVQKMGTIDQTLAIELFRIYNIPLMTEQNRLLGFGSAGMTQYINAPGTFTALVSNSFDIWVKSLTDPTVHIIYHQFTDVTGLPIDGEQITSVSLQGNGHMQGALTWQMQGHGGANDTIFTGNCDYGPLQVVNGIAGGGTYAFTIDGQGTFQIPYTYAANLDLSTLALPITTP